MVSSFQGDTIVSCDSIGVVKIWDVRKVAVIESQDFGPFSANSVTFNPLGSVVIAGSDDGSIKSYNITSQQVSDHADGLNDHLTPLL